MIDPFNVTVSNLFLVTLTIFNDHPSIDTHCAVWLTMTTIETMICLHRRARDHLHLCIIPPFFSFFTVHLTATSFYSWVIDVYAWRRHSFFTDWWKNVVDIIEFQYESWTSWRCEFWRDTGQTMMISVGWNETCRRIFALETRKMTNQWHQRRGTNR